MVVLYTIGCPKCKVIERKLHAKNIKFKIIDDIDKVIEYGNKVGIASAPILEVDDVAMGFNQAINYINSTEV